MKYLYFLKACNQYMLDCKQLVSYKTFTNYKTAIRVFANYLNCQNKRDITINSLTPALMKSFQVWLQTTDEYHKSLCSNTISAYFRSLRSLLHTLEDIYGLPRTNPFPQGSTSNFKTVKRAIDEEVIRELLNLNLSQDLSLERTRDYFVLSYFLCGIPFVDLAKLTKVNIQGNYLIYRRSKTGVEIPVEINPCIKYYLHKYNRGGAFLFPIMSGSEFCQKDYNVKLNAYNRHLKILEKIIREKLGQNSIRLTSYVARHTWATVAHRRNVPLSDISDSMGHTNSHTTLTYIREDKFFSISKANRAVCKSYYKFFDKFPLTAEDMK